MRSIDIDLRSDEAELDNRFRGDRGRVDGMEYGYGRYEVSLP